MLATFIYHEQWTLEVTSPVSTIRTSLYFTYSDLYPDRIRFVKTSLPWENDCDCPVLTGIPIHCSLLNRLMEVHAMQKALPDKMMNMIDKELDDRNMGQGSFDASRIIQSIEKSNKDLKQSLLRHIGKTTNTSSHSSLESIINSTVLNPGHTTRLNVDQESEHEVQLISKDDGVWAHYWDGHLHPIPSSFVFPKNQTLLRLWLSWHLPDISQKVCPFKLLKPNDVEHIPRGARTLYDMRLVMEVLIMKIQSIPTLNTRYILGLTDIFKKVKNVFFNANPKRINDRVGQLSWQTFVRDSRDLKYKIPFKSTENNSHENILDQNIDNSDSKVANKRKRQNDFVQDMTSIDNIVDEEFQSLSNKEEIDDARTEVYKVESSITNLKNEINTIEIDEATELLEGKGLVFEEGKKGSMDLRWDWTIRGIDSARILSKTASGKSCNIELKVYDREPVVYEKVRMSNVDSLIWQYRDRA